MLRKLRIVLALLFFVGITLLFVDVTDTSRRLFAWMPRLQLIPAIMALNVGVLAFLILLTLAFGRVYCSVICPLGVLQDIAARLGRWKQKNRYRFSRAKTRLRWTMLAAFVLLSLLGVQTLALLLAPYSSYGRMAQNLLSPLYRAGNNVLAHFAERADSYLFSASDISIRSAPTFVLAFVPAVLILVLAWRGGRTWCNTICPVGTVLGVLARFAWFKPVLNGDRCVRCRLCERRCKAACIDIASQTVDYSRCVACMNCVDNCPKGAVTYAHPRREREAEAETAADAAPAFASAERRGFLLALPAALGAFAATTGATPARAAEENRVDGGLAELKPRHRPKRTWPVRPPGAGGQKNFTVRCTGCQLCVAVCPDGVLRPSATPSGLLRPELHFDRGACRPECVRCAEVCPTGAIRRIDRAEKSAIHIGRAVWDKSLCLPATGGDKCDSCARRCPNGSISLIAFKTPEGKEAKVPSVDAERCLGCGLCEYVCPVRPLSAIRVDGYEMHREG